MKEKEQTVVERRLSNFTTKIKTAHMYRIPSEVLEQDENGNVTKRTMFVRDKTIDPEEKVSNYSIATAMDAGIDPSTRPMAPKVYDIGSNPEQLQRNVDYLTQQLDNEMVMKKYEELKKQREEEEKKKYTSPEEAARQAGE